MVEELICIECPRGCELTVEILQNSVNISGNFCPRGKKYAEDEMKCPRRIVTSVVRAEHGMIPVKTKGEVRKEKIMDVMKTIHCLRVDHDVALGEILVSDVDGEGCPLITTAAYRNV